MYQDIFGAFSGIVFICSAVVGAELYTIKKPGMHLFHGGIPKTKGVPKMPFLFKCQHCKTELEAQDEWEGQKTNCPNCQAEILIEKDAPPAAVPVVEETLPAQEENIAPVEKFVFMCPECGQIAELEAEQNGKQIECPNCAETVTAIPTEERPCPFCSENIKLKAKVCKHCKKQVPPFSSAPSNTSKQPVLNPDEKLCPKCGQTIKKQATFCRHCKQDIGNIVANVGTTGNIDIDNDSMMGGLFNKFALAVAPIIAKREFQNKENVLTFVNPFMRFLFWVAAIVSMIACVGFVFELIGIGKLLSKAYLFASIICYVLGFFSIFGTIFAYKRKSILLQKAIIIFMLISPILHIVFLIMADEITSRSSDSTILMIYGIRAVSLAGIIAGGYVFAFMMVEMLRKKPFAFDDLSITAFFNQAAATVTGMIAVLFFNSMETGVKIIIGILGILVIYLLTKCTLIAWMKTKFEMEKQS